VINPTRITWTQGWMWASRGDEDQSGGLWSWTVEPLATAHENERKEQGGIFVFTFPSCHWRWMEHKHEQPRASQPMGSIVVGGCGGQGGFS